MSVINKILGNLKKDGASAPSVKVVVPMDEAMKKKLVAAVLGIVVLSAAGVGGWLWWGARQHAVPTKVAQAPAKPIAASQPHVVAGPVATSGVGTGHEMAAPQSAVAPQQLAAGHEPQPAHDPVAQAHEVAAPEKTSSAKAEPVKVAQHEVTHKAQPPKEVVPEKPAPHKEEQTAKPDTKEAKPQPGAKEAKPQPKQGEHETKTAALDAAPASQDVHAEPAPTKPPVAEGRKKQRKAAASKPVPEKAADAAVGEGVDKQVKPLTDKQRAENEFRKANNLVRQGRYGEALEAYGLALQLEPTHDAARRAMVGLLLQSKRNGEAESLLQEGLKLNIRNGDFAMLLARIQIERNASWSALLTLQKTLPHAEQRADYRAFVAALLQRLDRNREAVVHYQAAVQLSPDSGVWWMGLGISLRAVQRNNEAKEAFQHALETGSLKPELQAFVERQIRDL